jgi:hypothetical protein
LRYRVRKRVLRSDTKTIILNTEKLQTTLTKLKTFALVKIIKSLNRQATNWKKVFVNHKSGKELDYIKNSQNSKKEKRQMQKTIM